MGYKVKKIFVGTNLVRPSSRLPSGYQEVEYIQSSGTQYINTGYVPNQNTKLTMDMGGWGARINQYTDLFGARLSWSGGRGFMFGCLDDNGTYFPYAMFGGSYNAASEFSSFIFYNGNNHSIEFSQSGIYEDGTLKKTFSTTTFTSPVNLYLFALNNNGSLSETSAYKLYSCKIYDNGTLVRDFVPCYRKSDGVIGLYDLVNNQFYTNSGSGTFTKGPDVN